MNAVQTNVETYPNTDWPFAFYFNGEELPKWSACWPPSLLNKHLNRNDFDEDVSDRDVYIISTMIDHCGVAESAPPAVFLFVVQSVLLLLLEHSEEASTAIRGFQDSPDPNEVMVGLIEGGLRMRELVLRDKLALWTSGYASDQTKLKTLMGELDSQPRPVRQFPHHERISFLLRIYLEIQIKQFHRLAQHGTLDKAMRSRLHQLSMPDESFLKLVT